MSIHELKNFTSPPRSYWMDSTIQSDRPPLQDNINVDIAIVGGGISGICAAYQLNTPGIRIAILEASQILQGTTGHTTAKITSQHGLIYHKIKTQISEELAKQYAQANETAIQFLEQTINKHGIECDFVKQSAYVYTMSDDYMDKINKESEAALSLGIKSTFLEKIPLPLPIKAAVRFENQAQFHPRKFLLPLADTLTQSGIQLYEQTRIVNLEEENGRYVLKTNQDKNIVADKVIIASHYPFYNKPSFYFARIYPERSYVIATKIKDSYPGGMYITAEEPGRSLRSQPTDQGNLLLIGGEHHKTGQGENTNIHYENLIDFATSTFQVESIPYRWSTQDCMTLDHIPYVGQYNSKTPNLYLATGYGKWGMTNSIASAMILKDLIFNGTSPWQDVYNPSRSTISSSAKNFIVENLNVAEKIVEGKLSSPPTDINLQPGEGKIIELNGQRSGVYKDEQGNLHIVDTTCPHMGCELNWNQAELTWDCPCHGSRFTYEGHIVDGPAVDPLNIHKNLNPIEKLVKEKF